MLIFVALCTLIVAAGYGIGYQASRKIEQALLNDINIQKAVISPGPVETSFGFFKATAVVKDSRVTFRQQEFKIPVIQAENRWHRIVTKIPDIFLKSDDGNISLKIQGIQTNSSIFDGLGAYQISKTEIEIGKIDIDSPMMAVMVEKTVIQLDNDPKKQTGTSALKIASVLVTDKSKSIDPIFSINNLDLGSDYQIGEQLICNVNFGISEFKADIKEADASGEFKNLSFSLELSSEKQIINDFNEIIGNRFGPENLLSTLSKYNVKTPKINFKLESIATKSPLFSFKIGQIRYDAVFKLTQANREEASAEGVIKDLDIDTQDFKIKLEQSTLKSTGVSNPLKMKAFNQKWSAFIANNDTPGLIKVMNELLYNIKGDVNLDYKNLALSTLRQVGLNSPNGKFDFGFEIKDGVMDLNINPAIHLNQLDKNPMMAMFLPIKFLENDLKINVRQLDIGTLVTAANENFVVKQSNLNSSSLNLIKISQKTPGISCDILLKTDQNVALKVEANFDLKALPNDFDLNLLINNQPQQLMPTQLISKILESSKIKLGFKVVEYKNLLKLTDQSLVGFYLKNIREQYTNFILDKGEDLESELSIENGKAILNGADVSYMLKAFGL